VAQYPQNSSVAKLAADGFRQALSVIETSGLSVVGCRMENRDEEEFAGRSVVITGAAGGIGIVLVQRFLTRGDALLPPYRKTTVARSDRSEP
jgi:NADPH:quinone reductase-like Zn-dependent oxidoreductase